MALRHNIGNIIEENRIFGTIISLAIGNSYIVFNAESGLLTVFVPDVNGVWGGFRAGSRAF